MHHHFLLCVLAFTLACTVDPTGGSSTSAAGGSDGTGATAGSGPACSAGETLDCYPGPPDTLNVGACRAGTKTCLDDGSWGPCEGATLPAREICGTAFDEDCDGVESPCSGDAYWALRFGDEDDQQALSLATDPAGNIFMTGEFSGTLDFGTGPMTAADLGGLYDDSFVVKLDGDGKPIWSRQLGAPAELWSASDSAGNVVIAGGFLTAVTLGGTTWAPDGADILVAKLDGAGNVSWSRRFGGPGDQWAYAVAVAPDDSIYVCGYFTDPLLGFGSETVPLVGIEDLYLMKLDTNGQEQWIKGFGSTWEDRARGLVVDADGNVYLTGTIGHPVDFGGGMLPAELYNLFVASFDAGGAHRWSESFPGNWYAVGEDLAIDSFGDVIVTGTVEGTITIGSETTTGQLNDILVARLASDNGAVLFGKRFENPGHQLAVEVAIDGEGDWHITGTIYGAPDFGGGVIDTMGVSNVLHLELDPQGAHLMSRGYGQTDYNGGYSVQIDPAGDVLLAGRFRETIDFGNGPLVSPGGMDGFLVKLAP